MRLSKRIKIIFFILTLFFFIVVFLYINLDKIKAKIPYGSQTFQFGLNIVYKLRDMADLVYLPKMQGESHIPTYEIVIDKANLEIMNEGLNKIEGDRVFSDDMKYAVPAKLGFKGYEYDIEISYRGAQDIHWNADKKSYSIRFDKNKKLGGMKKISLILPLDRKYFIEDLNSYRAKKFGLMYVPGEFVNVKVNGKLQGVYFVQEGWSDELLEHIGKSDEGRLYKTRDIRADFCKDREEYYYCIRRYASLWEQSAGKEDVESYNDLKKLFRIFDIEDDNEFKEEFEKIADVEKFLKWNVHYLLVQSYHQGISNLRLYFDPDTQKFEPVVWDVGMDMNHKHENIPSSLNEIDIKYNPFVDRILQVPEYRHRRNEILWGYVSNKTNLTDDLEYYNNQYNSIKLDFYRDRLKRKSNFSFDNDVLLFENNITEYYNNLYNIMQQGAYIVEQSKEGNNNYIDIVYEGFVGAVLQELEIKFIEESVYGGNISLYRDANNNFIFDFEDKKEMSVKMDNSKVVFKELESLILISFSEKNKVINPLFGQRYFIVSDLVNVDIKIKDTKTKVLNAVSGEGLLNF